MNGLSEKCAVEEFLHKKFLHEITYYGITFSASCYRVLIYPKGAKPNLKCLHRLNQSNDFTEKHRIIVSTYGYICVKMRLITKLPF